MLLDNLLGEVTASASSLVGVEASLGLVSGPRPGEEEAARSPAAALSSLSPLVSSQLSSFLILVLTFSSNSRLLSPGLSSSSGAASSDTLVMLLASLSSTALSLFLLLSFPARWRGEGETAADGEESNKNIYRAAEARAAGRILRDVANTWQGDGPRDFRSPSRC